METKDGTEVALWLDDEVLLRFAADDLLAALDMAVRALSTAQCFDVPSLGYDSYQVAAECGRAIAMNSPRALSGRPQTRRNEQYAVALHRCVVGKYFSQNPLIEKSWL